MTLGAKPCEINIGEVVQFTEPNDVLLDCFDAETNTCPILPVCALKQALFKAQKAFHDVLSSYTLEDVLQNKSEISMLLGITKR